MSEDVRNQEIYALRECGMSYGSLGIRFKLSPSRIQQICIHEQKRIEAEKAHDNAMNGAIPYTFYDALLDACKTKAQAHRIFKCLSRVGIINEIESHHGSLDSYSDEILCGIRNFGAKSLKFAREANELYKQFN